MFKKIKSLKEKGSVSLSLNHVIKAGESLELNEVEYKAMKPTIDALKSSMVVQVIDIDVKATKTKKVAPEKKTAVGGEEKKVVTSKVVTTSSKKASKKVSTQKATTDEPPRLVEIRAELAKLNEQAKAEGVTQEELEKIKEMALKLKEEAKQFKK